MSKLLLLEDEEIIARIYTKKLTQAGYEVTWMKTADEVQAAIPDLKSDIVLIDHGISGQRMSGLDVLPALREKLPQAKIIMLSNYSSLQLKEDSLKFGADAYLLKIDTPPLLLIDYLKQFN